jgi:hypothetical protein
MVYRGRVDHGVVVLEEGVRLPEGAVVDVVTLVSQTNAGGAEDLYHLDELAEPTGIPDLSLNVDHYLYGHPKVDDAQR